MPGSDNYNQTRTPEKAQSYIKQRFGSKRMQYQDTEEQSLAQKLASLVGPTGKIADVPCGSGRLFSAFSTVKQVFAFDYCESMVNESKAATGEQNHITCQQGDVKQLPLAAGEVDGVICMRLLHHVPTDEDRLTILKELGRVSKQWVALSFYRSDSFRNFLKKIRGRHVNGHPISTRHFARLAKQAGLEVTNLKRLRNAKQTLVMLKKSA